MHSVVSCHLLFPVSIYAKAAGLRNKGRSYLLQKKKLFDPRDEGGGDDTNLFSVMMLINLPPPSSLLSVYSV